MQNGKELWISQIYFSTENPVDRVNDAWTGQHGSGPRRTRGRDGTLPTRGVWALGLAGAHRWWQRRMSRERLCRRGAHQSTSDGGEAARWRRRTAAA
jgi:hypothetical protein